MGNLLSRVTSTAQALPSRVFLYAREKWGKSSLFAHAPGAIFFMTRGETGLTELIAGGRVPPTAHFHYDEADPPTWGTLREAVRELINEDHQHKALVIDTCNGAEILCQEHVRNSQFHGSQAKFASYGKGWDSCRVEWLGLLRDLDHLRSARKMSVVFLAHTQVKKFDDPTAEDSYDKYRPACQEKLWDLTHKWADIICFGHFEAQTFETESGKVKARADLKRVLCFDQSPTWEAGNRYGIGGKVNVSDGAKRGFAAFAGAVSKAKAAAQTPAANDKPAEPQPEPKSADHPPAAKEGEQRADFPAPEKTSPAPTAAATTGSTTPNAASPATNPKSATPTPDPAPKPAPAAERRTAPPKADSDVVMAGGAIVAVLLDLMHKLELSWPEVRDGTSEKGRELAHAAGLSKMPAGARVNQLTADEALRLKAEMEPRVARNKERAAKAAATKARNEVERAAAENVGSAS